MPMKTDHKRNEGVVCGIMFYPVPHTICNKLRAHKMAAKLRHVSAASNGCKCKKATCTVLS